MSLVTVNIVRLQSVSYPTTHNVYEHRTGLVLELQRLLKSNLTYFVIGHFNIVWYFLCIKPDRYSILLSNVLFLFFEVISSEPVLYELIRRPVQIIVVMEESFVIHRNICLNTVNYKPPCLCYLPCLINRWQITTNLKCNIKNGRVYVEWYQIKPINIQFLFKRKHKDAENTYSSLKISKLC